jgi:hypothetical protein
VSPQDLQRETIRSLKECEGWNSGTATVVANIDKPGQSG